MSEKDGKTNSKNLSRRDFLRNTGILAGGAVLGTGLLAGCSEGAAKDTPAPAGEAWDYEADVIVCGTGPAGLACAAAAAEAGVSVIAIDSNDKIGGKGILAGGNLGIGGGTRMQIAAGFEETAEIIYEDRTVPNLRTDKTMVVETVDGREVEMGQWRKISGAEDGEGMARAFADNSLDTWNWLDIMGVPFIKANVSQMAAVYRGSRYYTTTSPRLVDRENGKDGDMQAGGAGLCWPIYDTAVDNGAQFILSCKMTKILRAEGDRAGRVIGIEATLDGKTVRMKGNKAVFLGTGSWKGSTKLKQLFLPWLTKYPHISGEPYVWNDGNGIEAALDAGASLSTDRGSDWHGWHRHPGTLWHSIKMPFGLPGTAEPLDSECIYVNTEGKRFMNEEIGEDNPAWVGGSKPFYFAQLCAAQTTDKDGPVVWIILDEASRAKQELKFIVGETVEDFMYGTADTLEELAAAIKVPADALVASVTRYNELVDKGADEDFAKRHLNAKIAAPPFHAVKWGIQKHNTLGGVTINAKAQVVDWDLEPIPGLYAAGESAGNMDLIGLAKPIVFGRIAGMTIAHEE
ncbi:fumarate reductase/succinate dehydrogenase flavoprotein domain protein [Desulfitobacterium hafniense DCB-2]|uniref:Fumarate reductase/succinate dehydrogenase flavoprotein domain protein n=1 Tax=Desulfitobacterium hafniense (strain DSM 10664 / DCB-2) TaxID=272564 RepID=B8FRU5_DESHD|nr:FAD-binding protein [Desulfitobacterium hafniense]ACL20083.1 fumarate reductase/succinate dehydrogenase flavoprotein domain protein [Desulfitobacterium hafniense DCB-2]